MSPWSRAIMALRLTAIDPALGGCVVRARIGPARAAFMTCAHQIPRQKISLHPHMTADQLDASVDLTATLHSGSLIERDGLLQAPDAVFFLAMAERCDPYLASALAAKLDRRDGAILIALDEGATEQETAPAGLADRLAFHIVLDDIAMADLAPATLRTARFQTVTAPTDLPADLCMLAQRLGITSLRATSFALRCAKAAAMLDGRDAVNEADVVLAVELVFAPRATRIPQDDAPEPQDQSNSPDNDPAAQNDSTTIPDDILLEAVKAALPAGLLAKLQNSSGRKATGSGSGQKQIGNRRGRPLPARQGRRMTTGRIDLMATLRAAVPWQTLRKRDMPQRTGAIVLPVDLQTKRFEDKSDRLLIFTVDASGSAALARLAEAKGAVELLLSEAYARRDHVALIAFRGESADVLLHPTRSLVQTKRRLAALPGGGGTPLAAGLQAAGEMARAAAQKGLTPTVIVLTDGRSNIALDGRPDRGAAAQDAVAMAQNLATAQYDAMVIDTGRRPEHSLKALSDILNGCYLAMPRTDAAGLSRAVSAQLAP